MPVRFLKNTSEITDVTMESPLPVLVTNAKPVPVDALLIVTTTITSNIKDLLDSAIAEQPTVDGCGQYRRLVWFYFRTASAATSYRVLARMIDENGTPLGTGWQQLGLSTLPGGANTWGRLEIPIDIEGYYDQYRLEIWRTSGEDYTLRSKLIGVR